MTNRPNTDQSLAPLLHFIAAASEAADISTLAHTSIASLSQLFTAGGGAVWRFAPPQITCLYADRLDPATLQRQLEHVLTAGTAVFDTVPSPTGPPQSLSMLPLIVERVVLGALAIVTAAPLTQPECSTAELLAAFLGARLQALQARQLNEQLRLELEASSDGWHEFIGHASHEIKNPLASVKGYADLLLRRTSSASGDQFHKGLTIISQQSARATDLLSSMADTARIDSDRLQLDLRTVDLAGLLRRAIEQHSMAAKHTISLHAPDAPLHARLDEARIQQVLEAMLSNAIKFSPNGGPIEVRLEQSGTAERPEAIITVADQGIGVPPAEQREVFDRFKRGSNVRGMFSGLGLGLFAARQIVERHGGRMWLESALGHGATCFAALPIEVANEG